MTTEQRHDVLRQLQASGLRGRGGGWFPVFRKWSAVLAEDGAPFVVANGGEGEPGSIKDRCVLRTRPSDVVEGLRLAVGTLGAERGILYLKGSFREEEKRLRATIEARGLSELLSVHRGEDTYVGGEETALLEAIEGRRAWPRPKPPRASAVGLFGRPTLVQNVDTLARVGEAVRLGARFAEADTITLTVWGDVRRPGAYTVARGRTFRSVIETEAGGATRGVGLVLPNGAHSRPLTSEEIDLAIDPDACEAAGFRLGTASVLVLADDTDRASLVESAARFFEREACGQCPPCTGGFENLRKLVTGDRPPTIRMTPDGAIRETVGFMEIHGYCGHARAGARAVSAFFGLWRDAVLASFRGQGGRGEMRDPFAPASPERQALDAFLERL